MSYENILFEVKDNVGILTINRPKVLNALNPKTLDEIEDVIDKIYKENLARVLIITGAGDKAFVAGADISEFPKMNSLKAKLFAKKGQDIFFKIENLPIPVIACVNGYALGGGCELAMSCDFIYASEKAKFGQPEINLGIIPGFGGTQRLARLIGRAKAKELCMTGIQISAQEAKELGLVAQIFKPEELMDKTMEIAKSMSKKSMVALRAIKEVINKGTEVDLYTGCALEVEAFATSFSSEDAKEGATAFLEKRKPEFKGSLIS
jgi:enoyl-CoA hydratase